MMIMTRLPSTSDGRNLDRCARRNRGFKVRLTAIIAVRNEALYLRRCCEHLERHGIQFAIIDNDSTDDTRVIAESFSGRGLACVVSHPYPGYYDWTGLLTRKEQLARELDGDWFMHLDADEIPEPPRRHDSWLERIAAVDGEGYTAINFDEFVFAPITEDERHEGRDYVEEMHYSYFFEPRPQRLIRAWRRTAHVDLAGSAGHTVQLDDRRVYPVNCVLRHYIALSMDHLRRKYLRERVYSPDELAKGWHAMRSRLSLETIRTPPREELFDVRTDQDWTRSRPQQRHLFVR